MNLTLSIWSVIFFILGLLSLSMKWIFEGYYEPVVLIGLIFLILGVIFSFAAIAKQEKGRLKLISLFSIFLILFLITWFEPIDVTRMMTWLKNII
ncbi:hypothetical protein [Peribacillus acanthi]|uniref:hypothetical protein n=1 Tax=Peribacillus acanthi TaxID=2171554 RepID=UPI000D3E6A80|nr:hypothetical protein [Peribacillus acanthi]